MTTLADSAFINRSTEPGSAHVPSIYAHRLGQLSLVLWLLSLLLPAWALYNGDQTPGYYVLMTGWLGPIVGNIAWFANVFFLSAAVKLVFHDRPAPISASVGMLVALDTLRYDEVLLNEGGTTAPIYGYGAGAILWLAAISILLMATGFKLASKRQGEGIVSSHWALACCLGGGAMLALLVIFSAAFSVRDRLVANPTERIRLASVAFKRGPVCSADDPRPLAQLRLAGPLGLRNYDHVYPLNPEALLEWGIPVVRSEGKDFYFRNPSDPKTMDFSYAKGNANIQLEVVKKYSQESFEGFIRISMKSAESGAVAFDHTWRNEHGFRQMCPSYFSFPKEDQEPRKLVTSALEYTPPNRTMRYAAPKY